MEPPDPIPNSVVKRRFADGSVGFPHVRVGHRQAPKSKRPAPEQGVGLFDLGFDYLLLRNRPHVKTDVPQVPGLDAAGARRAIRRMIASGNHRVGHSHKQGWALVRLLKRKPLARSAGGFLFIGRLS